MEVIGAKLLANLPLIILTLALLVAIPMAYRAWAEAREDAEPSDPRDLLADLERAYYMGEIDAEEMNRVKAILLVPSPNRGAKPAAARIAPRHPAPSEPPGPSVTETETEATPDQS